MANLIVTLLSDQTIPNVQFIKEKSNENDLHLFVSTKRMNEKGVGNWIRNVCKIADDKIQVIEVDEFSLADIDSKLKSLIYSEYEHIFVNVTGGTKIMSMSVADFFKQKNADIYYLTGKDALHLFPEDKRRSAPLVDNISLKEYVESYGFELKGNAMPSSIPSNYTNKFISSFIKFSDDDRAVVEILRTEYRGKTCKTENIDGLNHFLDKINLDYSENKLTKEQVKYLTGEWFEDFVYYKIKEEIQVPDDNIKTGIHIVKDNVDNELDVVYLQDGKLYVIECKTLLDSKLLQETIYKSTALSKNLGLFAKFYIYTLSDKKTVEKQLERAKLFGIEIKCKEDLVEFLKEEKLC